MIASIRPRSMALDSRVANLTEIISLNIPPRCEARTNLPRCIGQPKPDGQGRILPRILKSVQREFRIRRERICRLLDGQVRFHQNENLSYRDLKGESERHEWPDTFSILRWFDDLSLLVVVVARPMKIKWRDSSKTARARNSVVDSRRTPVVAILSRTSHLWLGKCQR